MDSLADLRHACDEVRRLRMDGDSKTLLWWFNRREALLDELSARLKARV